MFVAINFLKFAHISPLHSVFQLEQFVLWEKTIPSGIQFLDHSEAECLIPGCVNLHNKNAFLKDVDVLPAIIS